MHYLVIEHFRGGEPGPVYARFAERGRQLPDGLEWVSSWVSEDLTRCYQVMCCEERGLLDVWMQRWEDLASFEVVPVVTSEEAARAVALR